MPTCMHILWLSLLLIADVTTFISPIDQRSWASLCLEDGAGFARIRSVDDTEPFAGRLVCYEASHWSWNDETFVIDGKKFAYIGRDDRGSDAHRNALGISRLSWDRYAKQSRLFSPLLSRHAPGRLPGYLHIEITNECVKQMELRVRDITVEELRTIEGARMAERAFFLRGDYYSGENFGF